MYPQPERPPPVAPQSATRWHCPSCFRACGYCYPAPTALSVPDEFALSDAADQSESGDGCQFDAASDVVERGSVNSEPQYENVAQAASDTANRPTSPPQVAFSHQFAAGDVSPSSRHASDRVDSDSDDGGGIQLQDHSDGAVSVDSLYCDTRDRGPRRHAPPVSPPPVSPPQHRVNTSSTSVAESQEYERVPWSPCVSKELFNKACADCDALTPDENDRLSKQLATHEWNIDFNDVERKFCNANIDVERVRALTHFRKRLERNASAALRREAMTNKTRNAAGQDPEMIEYFEALQAEGLELVAD
jgi:hypothetical protein